MSIKSVFFDMGGVLLRTEHQAPRQYLADRLGMEAEDLERLVFNSDSAYKASIGQITEEQHWAELTKRMRRPAAELDALRDEFFAGDTLDLTLINYLRSLKPRYKTGLISNAWSGLREYILKRKIEDAFHTLTISAEVGVVKPEARIYLLALDQAGVEPEEAVFVDDFIENIEGAQAVGMHTVHFRDPESALNELKQML